MRLMLLAGCALGLSSLSLAPAAAPLPVKSVRPGLGLIGRTSVHGKDAGIVFRYEHGSVFRHELVQRKFAERFDAKVPHRGAEVVLEGRLHVPRRMIVRVRFAGGSVSHGVQTLFLGGQELGSVGDDTRKSQVHELNLGKGTHPVKWVLTG